MAKAKKLLPFLTNSRRGTFQACCRKHHYAYDLRKSLIMEDREILNFGSLIHFGLEHWLKAPPKERLERAIAAIRKYYSDNYNERDKSPYELVKAEVLMIGYDIRWGDTPFDCVGAEIEFVLPLLHPETGSSSRTYKLAGKMDGVLDMVFEEVKGRWVIEHKTTKPDNLAPGSSYWRRLRMDGQVSMYWDAAERRGWEIEGVIYDVIGRPDQRPMKATPEETKRWTKGKKCKVCTAVGWVAEIDERGKPTGKISNPDTEQTEKGRTPENCSICKGSCYETEPWLDKRQRAVDETVDEYRQRLTDLVSAEPWNFYQRGKIIRLDDEIADARWDLWLTAKMMREVEKSGRYPRNTNSCTMYNRTCSFFEVCARAADIEDPHLFETRSLTHPELSEEIQPVHEIVHKPKEKEQGHGDEKSSVEEDARDYEELPF